MVVGTTGSGKSLTINGLMAEVLPAIEEGSDCRALIYDSKQDVLSALAGMKLRCPVVTLNPFDQRSKAWDIASDVTSPAAALQVATVLVPEDNGNNRFFSDAARDLLAATMLSFIESSPGSWSLADVVFGMRSGERLRSILARSERGRDLIEAYFSEEKTLRNILATLRSRLAPFEPIAAMWSRASEIVSLKSWVSGEFVLVLASNEAVRAPLDAINRVIFKRLTELVLAVGESKTRRSWFFLDEVREAGKLPGLTSLLTKGRSKGACAVLGFQDVAGMKEAHGEHLANEIIGQCSNKAILRLESPETAEWAARMLGDYEAIEMMESVNTDWTRKNRTRAEQYRKAPAVLASEFLTLPPTNPRCGLSGYYLSPYVGAYRSRLLLADVLATLPKEDTEESNFIARDDSEQYLESWTEGDFERLFLEPGSSPVLEPRQPRPGKLRLLKQARAVQTPAQQLG